MGTINLLEYALFSQAFCACAVLVILVQKKLVRKFSYLTSFAAVWGLDTFVRISILYFRPQLGLDRQTAYNRYFFSYWGFTILEHALMLFMIYQVFLKAMSPFKGLSRFGTVVFKWVCGVAIVVSLGMTMIPGRTTQQSIITTSAQFEQAISILTLCLLLFVCFSIRYLGMNYRSHLFGVSLGLGILGTLSLVQSSWFASHSVHSVYSVSAIVDAFGDVTVLMVWGFYFLRPEPKQQMVLLPTTSPYFHWNQISEALGDNPGVVAVAGFTPDSLSSTERLVLGASRGRTAMSASMPGPATVTGTQF